MPRTTHRSPVRFSLPRIAAAALVAGAALWAGPAAAERGQPARRDQPPAPKFEREGTGAMLEGLDKVTASVTSLSGDIGKVVKFGSLEITVRRCLRSLPDQKLERTAFLEIDDINPTTGLRRRVFSGWMFASNPALSALDHPVYDVWVKDCK